MPIVFSALVPHSPILIPSIGKGNINRIKITLKAYQKLSEKLKNSKPDSIIIITPHGPIQENVFTINLNPEFEGKFEEFGDFSIKLKMNGDIGLIHKIREALETKAPLTLISEPLLDYGASVPLYLLAKDLKNIKIIPIYYSELDLPAHFKFGQLLQHELIISQENIAIIASGDLSHRLSEDAPAGYSPKAKKFDSKVIEYLKNKEINNLNNFDKNLIAEAAECGLRSIVLLMGILNRINYKPVQLSYEAPFGVGYLIMNFVI